MEGEEKEEVHYMLTAENLQEKIQSRPVAHVGLHNCTVSIFSLSKETFEILRHESCSSFFTVSKYILVGSF